MKTPICDFIEQYSKDEYIRLHMPGHKGKIHTGCEKSDITEVFGADVLYNADGIIKESYENARSLFKAGMTLYSTEGSSLCVRAMLYLAKLNMGTRANVVLATRNAHSSFISASALLGFDIDFIYPEDSNYLSAKITPEELDKRLSQSLKKPFCVYVTSPDYLGNMLDIEGLSRVCHLHGLPLLVDNAHGAYLAFLEKSEHPIAMGADMCCDSAHKTLPVLTGGAYLHVSEGFKEAMPSARDAMRLFASTSPSYLILKSLDKANAYLENGYGARLGELIRKVDSLKAELTEHGYTLVGNEKIKLSIKAKELGYLGTELADILYRAKIVCELCDEDYLVLMLTPDNSGPEIEALKKALLSIEKRDRILTCPPKLEPLETVFSPREAIFKKKKRVKTENALGKVYGDMCVSCPPAVSIAVCGERLNESAIALLKYYKIEEISIIE